jgi:hypothetical protein
MVHHDGAAAHHMQLSQSSGAGKVVVAAKPAVEKDRCIKNISVKKF